MPFYLLATRAVAVPQIAAKRKRSSKRGKKPAPKKRKKPAPKKRSAAAKKRSAAAKKGWAKRKKKKRLHEAMADIRMQKTDQPHGWLERREHLRTDREGEVWRKISVEFSQKAYDRVRLETLADLEIDFLNRDELADYLGWMAEEIDIDLSDAYRFYLGYGLQVDQGDA